MIPLHRIDLSPRVQGLLTRATGRVKTRGGTSAIARKTWKDADGTTKHVRQALESMARGAVRCMYCDDNRGMAIDHFEPLERAPLRAFEWLNHLLSCAYCNSDVKREEYPVDANGFCLLINPTIEDPAEHLQLMLASGEYEPVNGSPKGVESIRVFGLNRPDLIKGRQDAFDLACSNIRDWHFQRQSNDVRADRVAKALLDRPFIDVVHAMTRLKPSVAAIVVGQDTVPALVAWQAEYGL
ncbi:HNH endonuclease [Kitasatospora indigofera]|uniref:HNH endonuclease n=2 Tax=Kitasatospora indigofera TaxID=67307 RepID=A0A919L1E6_9ACTN|nr:HNH endonuclease [Kitasatospora indigofera]